MQSMALTDKPIHLHAYSIFPGEGSKSLMQDKHFCDQLAPTNLKKFCFWKTGRKSIEGLVYW